MGHLAYADPNYDSVQVDVRAAEREPMYKRIKKLMPHCVLTTRPHRKLSAVLHKTDGGMFVPDEHSHLCNEWTFIVTVLKVGKDCDPEVVPGVAVLVPQFSGGPIFDDTDERALSLWMMSDSELMGVVES
jgi:hypothetical protein